QFGVLEREALGPPRRAGEFIEERDVVGAFRRLAHHFVDLVSIRPDENAPAIGLDAVEDDRRGLCRAGQRLVTKTPLERGHEVTQLIVRQLRDVAAQQSKALPRLGETSSIDRVRFAIAAVDLARVGADRGPDLAGHDNRAFDVRRVAPAARPVRGRADTPGPPPLRAQRLETVFEEALVVHSGPLLVTVILAEGLP